VILALDTTAEYGSIALLERQSLVEEVLIHSTEGFGHVLYDHIARLLDRHRLRVQDIDCFAAASGPGSFTGVRIGLAAVQGLAEATQRCVVPVSNLQALACFGSADLRATLIDARRGEIYGAVYDRDLRLHSPEVVMKFDDWTRTLPGAGIELITSASFSAGMPTITAPLALASAIGLIAERRFTAGAALNPAEIDANYVRRSDAELLWRTPGDPTAPLSPRNK